MDVAYIKAQIEEIKEDTLHQEVLSAIAEGKCSDPTECAKEALKTLQLEFCRWYA